MPRGDEVPVIRTTRDRMPLPHSLSCRAGQCDRDRNAAGALDEASYASIQFCMFGSRPLNTAEHTARPWRIHEIANDFRLLDVWALPTPGGRHDFPQLVRLMSTFDPSQTSVVVRALFSVRWTIGRLFGLDRPETGLGGRVTTLRDRLPADLSSAPTG